MRRVLIVGLDGATFDVIQPLAERGRLPNLARMMREGTWGTLRSTVPPNGYSAEEAATVEEQLRALGYS